jgi:hypothetical protein
VLDPDAVKLADTVLKVRLLQQESLACSLTDCTVTVQQ